MIITPRYTPKMFDAHLSMRCVFVLLAAGAGILSGCAGAGQQMRLHFVDVGQGDATLIELPCAAVLVDTGGEKNAQFSGVDRLEQYLDRFFRRRVDLARQLDLLVLTHAHIDHTRGAKRILERFSPKHIITNGLEIGSGRHGQIAAHRSPTAKVERVRAGQIPPGGYTSPVVDPIRCDAVDPELRVLWGGLEDEREEKNGNNHSVVLRIGFGPASALFTGDLETEMIAEMIELHRRQDVLDVDVYQVGHHGSSNGTTAALLEAMTPEFAVISMGPPSREHAWTAWAFGHPRAVVIDLLEPKVSASRWTKRVWVGTGAKQFEMREVKAAVYATGWDGDVVLETGLDGMWRLGQIDD